MLIAKISGALEKFDLHWPNTALTLNGFQVNGNNITVLLGYLLEAFNIVSSYSNEAWQ